MISLDWLARHRPALMRSIALVKAINPEPTTGEYSQVAQKTYRAFT
jgi:hypothetical protein